MPVRNALPHLKASIRSIVEQSHDAFEFVIRDDASSDSSRDVLREWAQRDARIRLFEGEEWLGPAGSSNWVVGQARAPIIARMDADDVAHPERLRRQFEVLRRHPSVDMVGTLSQGIDDSGRVVRGRDRSVLTRRAHVPFAHGSVMFRKAAFERVGGYRGICDFWEDRDLFLRMARMGRVVVLPEALYQYRFSSTSARLNEDRDMVERALDRGLRFRAHAGKPGRDWPALDAEDIGDGAPGKILPDVFVSIGHMRVWSGRRPGVLFPLLRRSALDFDGRTAAVLAWALWSEVSPKTLRMLLSFRVRIRDLMAGRRIKDGRMYDWPIMVRRRR